MNLIKKKVQQIDVNIEPEDEKDKKKNQKAPTRNGN